MFFQPILLNDETFDIRVAQMGNYPSHWHSDLEMIFCREGTFDMYIGETKYTVGKDDIILVGSCEAHQICGCTRASKVVMIRLGSLFLRKRKFQKDGAEPF